MKQDIFIGVDGGATKTIVRVETASGELVGQELAGPANIRLSVPKAWQSIHAALEKILSNKNISMPKKQYRLHAGMGLAGSEIAAAYQAFLHTPHPFDSLMVVSDAHIACLGAHGGRDGAIVAIGTGIVGYAIHAGSQTKVSGWGFPHDDLGSGAWLGLEATKITLQSLDGRSHVSGLSKAIYQHFQNNKNDFVSWANQANSTAFAELAPIVINEAQCGDVAAKQLLQQAANYVEQIAAALQVKQQLPCALIGGLAKTLQPYLSKTFQQTLVVCENTSEMGALLLIRQHWKPEAKNA